jgi:WD40 repeat protein
MLTTLLVSLLVSLSQAETPIVLRNRPKITQAVFHPDGKRLYCVTHAGVEAYDTTTGQLLFDAPYGRHLFCSPNGDKFALVSRSIGMIHISGTIVVLDGNTGKKLHQGAGTSAAFSPDGRWLISHSGFDVGHPETDLPPKVQITDLRTGKTHLAQLKALPEKKALPFGQHQGAANFYFTKDSKFLVSGVHGESGKYKIMAACDLETGEPCEKLPADDQLHVLRDLRYSSDGKRFVDRWTVFDEQGKPIAKLNSADIKAGGWKNTFQMSPDGKTVFGVSSDRWLEPLEKANQSVQTRVSRLHAWDADSGDWKRTLIEAKHVLTMPLITRKKVGNAYSEDPQFAINAQGTTAIDYTSDGALTVWNLATGKAVRKLRQTGHSARPEILTFSPDSRWLATASTDGEVQIWNAKTGQPARALDRAAYLGDVRFRPNSKELIGVGHDLIYVWNIETGALLRTFASAGYVARVDCAPDGKIMAVGDHRQSRTVLIDIDSGKTLHTLNTKGHSLAFHPNGKLLLSLDSNGMVALWDSATGKNLQKWFGGKSNDYRYIPHQAAFLAGGERFVLRENNTVTVMDIKTNKQVLQHTLKLETHYDFHKMAVHPDGRRFAMGQYGPQDVTEFDLTSAKVLRTYPGHAHVTSQVQYSPDGMRLATTGGYDFVIRIHNVPSLKASE